MSQPTFTLRLEIHRQSWLSLRQKINAKLRTIDGQVVKLEHIPAELLEGWQHHQLQILIADGQLFAAICLLVDGLFEEFLAETTHWNEMLIKAYSSLAELDYLRNFHQESCKNQDLNNQTIERLAQTILNRPKQ